MPDFTRKTLYDLVWTTPASRLAKEYAISDVGLGKLCRRQEIPRPPRGYWARLQAGQNHTRTPLPPMPSNDFQIVVHIRLRSELEEEDDCETEAEVVQEPPEIRFPELGPQPEFPDDLDDIRNAWLEKARKVPVPRLARQSHPAIGAVLRADDERRASGRRDYWGRLERPLYASKLDKRRLRLLNRIFVALEQLGGSCEIEGNGIWESRAEIHGVSIPFFLGAPSAFRRGRQIKASQLQLELRVGSAERLADAKGVWNENEAPLDQQLAEIVAGILTAGEILGRELAVRNYQESVRRRERQIEEEERQRARQDAARRKWLVAEATAYRTAATVRAFVEAVRADGRLRGETLDQDELESWAAWALSAADKLDPLLSPTAKEESSLRPNRWGGWW